MYDGTNQTKIPHFVMAKWSLDCIRKGESGQYWRRCGGPGNPQIGEHNMWIKSFTMKIWQLRILYLISCHQRAKCHQGQDSIGLQIYIGSLKPIEWQIDNCQVSSEGPAEGEQWRVEVKERNPVCGGDQADHPGECRSRLGQYFIHGLWDVFIKQFVKR